MSCARLDEYLDGHLAPEARAAFEAHAQGCEGCAARIKAWQQLRVEVQAWANAALASPSAVELASLTRRATLPPAGSLPRWLPGRRWQLVFALSAVAAAVVWFVPRFTLHEHGKEVLLQYVVGPEAGRQAPARQGAVIASSGHPVVAELAGDRIGLRRDSAIELTGLDKRDVHWRLRRGSAAFAVKPRRGQGQLQVEAGRFSVRVVGTRFLVTLHDSGDAEVAVSEGQVQVKVDAREYSVAAGSQLQLSVIEDPEAEPLAAGGREIIEAMLAGDAQAPAVAPEDHEAAAEPPAPAPSEPRAKHSAPTDLGQARRLILAGENETAERILSAQVRRKPGDLEAWSLLADCRRRAGHWEEAVAAYRVVVKQGGARAERARLLAASILQDQLQDPAGAATLLRAYLGQRGLPETLEQSVSLRLARCLTLVHANQEARDVLGRLVRKYPTSPAAGEARTLIEELR